MTRANPKAMRADARRNYERLLDEARTAFAGQGTDASLEEIARRAGVGIGTLYRHFPTREALLEALLRDRLDAQTAYAADLLAAADPMDALRAWATRLARTTTSFRGLADAFTEALADKSSQLHRSCVAMRDGVRDLVARAHAAGQLAEQVTELEVLLLVNSVAWAAERTPRGGPSLERLVSLTFDGLRVR